jgi:hypothetical protein
MNSLVIFANAIRPGMGLTETFIHIKCVSGAVNRIRGKNGVDTLE